MKQLIVQLRVILSTMSTALCPIGVFLLVALFGSASGRLGARSDHISLSFYIAGEIADNAKDSLRELLDSPPYDASGNASQNLDRIPSHFEATYNASSIFATTAEIFFNEAKNESANLLLKLRQVPSTDSISEKIKSQLTDYFTEMENFHVIMCSVLDDTTEFILDSVQMLQNNLLQFGDVRNEMLERSRTQVDEWCLNRCNEFLWMSAEQVLACFMGNMGLSYDVYSITKMTTYHVMKMLEHRIQKLYNCFLFGNYPIRCRFVRNPEADFEKLHTRIEELQMYNDKQKRKTYYNRQRGVPIKCIPVNFPHDQMPESLKSCFFYAQHSPLEE